MLSDWVMIGRLLCAAVLGGMVGFERERAALGGGAANTYAGVHRVVPDRHRLGLRLP